MRSKRRPPPIDPRRGSGDHRINRRIRVPMVQLVDHEGTNHGEIETAAALKIAEDAGLDLVEVSPTAKPPVCKILNYGQYKYLQKKRQRGSKSHQAKVKTVRLHPGTAEHDIQVRLRSAIKFLGQGDKVQVMVWFKGREMQHKERGTELCERFVKELKEEAKVESMIRMEGKRMHLLLAPLTQEEKNARKKAELAEKERASKAETSTAEVTEGE